MKWRFLSRTLRRENAGVFSLADAYILTGFITRRGLHLVFDSVFNSYYNALVPATLKEEKINVIAHLYSLFFLAFVKCSDEPGT